MNQSRPQVLRKIRQRLNLNNCDDATMESLVSMFRDHRVKTHKRTDLVTRCMQDDTSSFPGCGAFPLPPESTKDVRRLKEIEI